MKQMLFFLFASLAFPVAAQAPAKDAAKPAPTKEAAKAAAEPAKPAPTKEAAKPEPVKEAAAAPRKPRRWNEDARHCLERGSNTDIIKCAEEFL